MPNDECRFNDQTAMSNAEGKSAPQVGALHYKKLLKMLPAAPMRMVSLQVASRQVNKSRPATDPIGDRDGQEKKRLPHAEEGGERPGEKRCCSGQGLAVLL
jgi:hypothetical protein